jgi:hypothetical protein
MVQIDVAHVFRIFGGPRGLLTILDQHQPGHGAHYNTVQMWSGRKTIPTKYVAAILYCCEQEGHHCREFFIDNDEFA